MIRHLNLIAMSLLLSSGLMGQTTGTLKGVVKDGSSGETLPLATVKLLKDGIIVQGTESDYDGVYNFSKIEAGTYALQAEYVGIQTFRVEGIPVRVGKIEIVDLVSPSSGSGEVIDEVVVKKFRIPIIDGTRTGGGQTLSGKDVDRMATRDIGTIRAATAGVNQADEGEASSSNGSRSSSNDTYIDGVRVIGGFNVPDTEIDQIQVITSGIPAEYGDATGAITNIITKGPSNEFSGGVRVETSEFLDGFAANRVDASFSGPILSEPYIIEEDTLKHKNGTIKKRTILGFRLAGYYNTNLDSRPSALGWYRLKDEVKNTILENPLVLNDAGNVVYASDTLTAASIERVKARPNGRSHEIVANAKVEFKPANDFYFVAGGQMRQNQGYLPSTTNNLFNYDFNPKYRQTEWRTYGRFRHTVSSTTVRADEDKDKTDTTKVAKVQPVFQNFSYELQGDFTQTNFAQEDPRYGDALFNYGYIGKFYRSLRPTTGVIDTNFIVNSVGDTLAEEPVRGHAGYNIAYNGYEENATINPGLANYNNLIDLDNVSNIDEFEIINGQFNFSRAGVFGLFNSPHNTGSTTRLGNSYGKSNTNQIRGVIKANFDLVSNQGKGKGGAIRHSISLGGVYEQRISRSYSISPARLWILADQGANSHLNLVTDIERPNGGEYYDPFLQRYYETYDPLIRKEEDGSLVEMTQFGERVRESLDKTQYDWINVHELDPTTLDLSMFEPSTLITGRQRILDYYGYDYLGNATGSNIAFNDFFTATDPTTGRKTRPVAPNRPIYVAGYIQNEFTYKDIFCRFGVRFDSYDANTKVLKDPYSVAGYYTVAEFENAASPYTAGKSSEYTRPTNIGDDYVVYVNENSPDASIVGFRDGEKWYNTSGVPVNNPNELASIILPALRGFTSAETSTQGDNYNPDLAFRDYIPNVLIMPRIAFSFPISEKANFYANYDILAQRPPAATLATPMTYFNFVELATASDDSRFIRNPNLRSQRVINYEVGFQQQLNTFSGIRLSLLYREERDLIQLRQYILAYPISYTSYGNDDFSTTKSFKLEYDLRGGSTGLKNVRLLANYTLQFAEGTGSSPTSSAGVAAEELRYVFPLSFDQRHTFFLNIDYRYKSGREYNGPKIYGKKDASGVAKSVDILANTGLNLSFNANSGRPYTRREIPGGIGTSFPNRNTEGSVNGARMPWNFRVDLKVDKSFQLKTNANSKKPVQVNVYFRVQNLFNTKNPLRVYPVTGSPVDDGFLTTEGSPGLGLLESSALAYELLYGLRMNNPFNISRPRRMFLGIQFGF